MQWKVEYETQDKDINPEWHWIFWIDKIYVKREFTIDVPDTDTLFRVIDALEEWYFELRLRKLEIVLRERMLEFIVIILELLLRIDIYLIL